MKKLWVLIKRCFLVIWLICVAVVFIIIYRDNQVLVSFNLLSWQLEYSLGALIILILLLGIVLAMLPFVIALFFSKQKVLRLNKKVQHLNTELRQSRLVASKSQL